jgi:hypothetical protein
MVPWHARCAAAVATTVGEPAATPHYIHVDIDPHSEVSEVRESDNRAVDRYRRLPSGADDQEVSVSMEAPLSLIERRQLESPVRAQPSQGSGTTLVGDGLFGLVKAGPSRDPLSGDLFLFVGKRRNACAESRPLHSLQFLS